VCDEPPELPVLEPPQAESVNATGKAKYSAALLAAGVIGRAIWRSPLRPLGPPGPAPVNVRSHRRTWEYPGGETWVTASGRRGRTVNENIAQPLCSKMCNVHRRRRRVPRAVVQLARGEGPGRVGPTVGQISREGGRRARRTHPTWRSTPFAGSGTRRTSPRSRRQRAVGGTLGT
jgi:hypothetical protein